MMFKTIRMILTVCMLAPWTLAAGADKDKVDYINPMIGAITLGGYGGHGLGKTFPGATTPFGMVQLSPDTITGGDNGPGYSSHHDTIEGFSFTHMSGIGWYGDLGNLQVMPATGPLQFHSGSNKLDLYKGQGEGWKSPYRHEAETARAGYYSVVLDKYNIQVETTATPRTGMLRMTFPESSDSHIQIDLARRVGGRARHQSIQVLNDHTIQGTMRYEGDGNGFASRTRYTFYFYAEFSRPWDAFGLWNRGENLGAVIEAENEDLGFYAQFKTLQNEQILMKSGISFVSLANARANLETELPHWNFEQVRRQARSLWANALKGVDIEGGTEKQKEIFATALYHCSIDPRIFVDTNGEFFGADYKVHRSELFNYRTIFSGWDVFRSQFPLQTLINPAMVNDEINSLIHLAEFNDRQAFPRWELLSTHTGCMLGNPAISVIADAYTKGIRKYDINKAYHYCVATAEKYRNQDCGYTPGDVSRTLEYAYTDWCVAKLAEALDKPGDAKNYGERALAYKTIWDPNVAWFHSRNGDGTWTKWKGKTVHGQGCTESNPYQQGWFVPQDVYGLMDLMGGRDQFLKELTAFFDNVPADMLWNDYYNHANEPCHHVVFLFNYAGVPWLTQKWSRAICDVAYSTGVRGLCGNEDVGQMSAWYVLAAMGLHPVCPGDGIYQLTSPVFDKVSIRLDPAYYPGGTFTVVAQNNSKDNVYIQSARLNGQPLNRAWITHQEIASGGTLEFVLGPTPNTAWATAPENRPPSPVKH